MYEDRVEIYSDVSNFAILRHPDRKFPGSLIQGDTLYSLCQIADDICAKAKASLDVEVYGELNDLRNALQSRLAHYKKVLGEHGMELPFSEHP